MLPWEWALVRLRDSRNYWISSVRPDGSPHAMPVWGVLLDETVCFGTSATSRKGRNLAADPRVVVHTESGDECVILEGEVEPIALDDRIADAYEAKYETYRPDAAKTEGGLWLRVRPRVAWAWREAEYTKTATRFTFP
jgi:pyridoxine/pyridoxamine 5'-phosphate oxidase